MIILMRKVFGKNKGIEPVKPNSASFGSLAERLQLTELSISNRTAFIFTIGNFTVMCGPDFRELSSAIIEILWKSLPFQLLSSCVFSLRDGQ